MAKLFFAGCLLLLLNSAYLAVFASPTLFYAFNVLFHVGFGVVLALPFLIHGVRLVRTAASDPGRWGALALQMGFWLMVGSITAGIALIILGNVRPNRWLLHVHIATAVTAVVLLAGGLRARASRPQATPVVKRAWQLTAATMVVSFILPLLVILFKAVSPDPYRVENPAIPPPSMDEEGMLGKDGPFFPSAVETASRSKISTDFLMQSESCGRSGCHADIYKQWNSSAHHFSSFNNQWYRKSIEYMQDVIGVKPSKWCGGCHDLAVLLNGMMDTPIREIVHTPQAQAGLGCTACHSIVKVKDTMGNGGYMIEYPPLHDLATSENKFLRLIHDFILRVDPEPHKKTFLKPFHRQNRAEFCSACHKVHLDKPVNNYRWFRGFNDYDAWQSSGVSGQGARSFYYPVQSQDCVDCHMPLMPSKDAGNIDGFVHSHRFPAANTALAIANRDEEQLKTVIDFLQNKRLTVDIFALGEPFSRGVHSSDGHSPDHPLETATTFAVGEEQEMGVEGGVISLKTTPIIAPLDRPGATVRRGDTVRIDVVVRTRSVGHFFPAGTVDAFDVWLELKAVDNGDRTIFWSGAVEDGGKGPVEKGAHFYRSLQLDGHGNPINKRNAWATRAVLYVNLIPPGAADTVHFRLRVPEDCGDTLYLTAKLNYRKFAWWHTQWAFAGERDPSHKNFVLSAHYDDGRWLFTGDTSDVSGQIKSIPDLPIVTLATAEATLGVVDAQAPLPEMKAEPRPEDRERWNDYGIGLLQQGLVRGAEEAFLKVTEIDPTYADGWVNVARARLRERNIQGAREALEKALAVDPDLPKTHYFYALALKTQGQYDQALEHLRKAAAVYPQDRVVRNEIGRLLFLQGRYAEAIEELKQVLKIDPEDLAAHYNLMLSYRGVGNLAEAQREYQLYLRFKADDSARAIIGNYWRVNPGDNNERQPVHEHVSVPLG